MHVKGFANAIRFPQDEIYLTKLRSLSKPLAAVVVVVGGTVGRVTEQRIYEGRRVGCVTKYNEGCLQ